MARAQQYAPAGAAGGRTEQIVRIRRIDGTGTRSLVRTPNFTARTNLPGGTKPARQWWMILVEYDTAPEWIDELVFQYYAMGETREEGQPRYSLYKTTVRYADIPRGMRHLSVVFLRPAAIERFGQIGAVAVEIIHEGNVIAELSDQKIRNLPEERWWRDPRVVDSPAVTLRDGYLLNRSNTPFALVNIDDFQDIK